jgi:O-antigen ligase
MRSLRVASVAAISAIAAAFFLALLYSLTAVADVPAMALAGLAALAVLAAVKPELGLVVVAAGVPVASWIGRHWTGAVAWPETLAVAFCAGYCARGLRAIRDRDAGSPDALTPPLSTALTVVVGSLVVQLLVDGWRFGETQFLSDLWQLVRSGYFVTATAADPIDAAMRLLESLILFRATATVARTTPPSAMRLTVSLATGAVAAAALNLVRLWEAASRADAPLAAFAQLFATVRLNVHYSDVNAAGSYFIAMLFITIGLACSPKRRAWVPAVPLIASSLWLSGSRMAFVASVLAILVPAVLFITRISRVGVRGTALAGAALMLTILAGVAAYAIPMRGNQKSPLTALQVRWELALTSFRMTAVSPAFGVGIGRYYSRSGEFSSPELLRLFPPAIHENAHNNFLQWLAELGMVGFGATMWLLVVVGGRAASSVRAAPHDPIRWGLLLGAVSFILTWLGSHPLLIDEPAMTFWLLLGVIAGSGAATAEQAPAGTGRGRSIATILVVATLISIPLRFVQQRADFDLQHRGVGLSPWQDAVDGVRYRLAQTASSVFVPSDARVIVVPLRATPQHPELRVRLLLDGRPADVVTVAAERWQSLRIQVPPERRPPRFRRLEFAVDGAPAETDVLMVGKVETF